MAVKSGVERSSTEVKPRAHHGPAMSAIPAGMMVPGVVPPFFAMAPAMMTVPPQLHPAYAAQMMMAFGPSEHVAGLRRQAAETAASGKDLRSGKHHSPSASDGSHHTTHCEDADGVEDGVEAYSRSTVLMSPRVYEGGVLKNARLEALAVPDRTQTPGIQSPGAAANVLINMMACPTLAASMGSPLSRGAKRANKTTEYLGPLSVRCPKKRRTVKATRVRADLKTFQNANGPSVVRVTTKTNASGKPKAHRPWTLVEVEALVRGVTHYGRGQWADIKALNIDGVSAALVNRSAVDLKDKWRNLLRVAMMPALYKRREVNGVPTEILEQVRVLAASKASNEPRKHKDSRLSREARQSAPAVAVAPPAVKSEPASAPAAADAAKGARRSKHHSPWTMTEAMALVDGVDRCGGCRWTIIKKSNDPALERRTAMDLKDKWRNLLQLASLPANSRRKQETPAGFLQRVLDLEAQYGSARRKGRKAKVETA
jgi:hypothetical protein